MGLCRTQCNKLIEAMKEECNAKIAADKLEKQKTPEKVAPQVQLCEKWPKMTLFMVILLFLVSLSPFHLTQSLAFTEC